MNAVGDASTTLSTVTVSIAMATFNGAEYLQAQLDSFTRQTRPPDELVVCDDGSSDATLEILHRFRQQASFPVAIHSNPTTLGYIRNFERALSLCSGNIIFLSDQDDVWFDGKLAAMSAILESDTKLQVLVADMVLTDGQLRPTRYTQLGNIIDVGMPETSFVAGCATALKRDWLDMVVPIPAPIAAHDNWIHRLAVALDVRRVLPLPQQYYRRHQDNASTSVASSPEKMTALRSFSEHGLDDAKLAWQEELERVVATRSRIAGSAASLDALALLDRQAAALAELDAHAAALDRRIHSSQTSRLGRLPRVWNMWLKDDYRHFNGWKSALKDVLRP